MLTVGSVSGAGTTGDTFGNGGIALMPFTGVSAVSGFQTYATSMTSAMVTTKVTTKTMSGIIV
jgi:hypothetical protein